MKKNVKTRYKGPYIHRRLHYPTMYNLIINESFEENYSMQPSTVESRAFWGELYRVTGFWKKSAFRDKKHAKQIFDFFFGYKNEKEY